jgi:hypothetical protein
VARINTSVLDVAIKKSTAKTFKSGNIGSKLAASAKFHMELLNKIHNEEKKRIQVAGLKYLMNYFEAYVDNIARSNPKSLHHVYEPGMVGGSNGRLFQGTISETGKPNLVYKFKESKIPMDSGHIFRNKAFIMEEGITVTITPKNAKVLVFEIDGEIVSSHKVVVNNPGGKSVQGSFVKLFNHFMTSVAGTALQDMDFFSRIEKGIEKESKIVLRRINKGDINTMAMASAASSRIVRSL